MSKFYPYNFIDVPKEAPKREGVGSGHLKFNGNSGYLECSLDIVTPLFIPSSDPRHIKNEMIPTNRGYDEHKCKKFITRESKPVIPGSTLKGMIRSICEAVSNSCVSKFTGRYSSLRFDSAARRMEPMTIESFDGIDRAHKHEACTGNNNLCLCCRLFGYSADNQSLNFAGKVGISDAQLTDQSKADGNFTTLPEQSGPKVHHLDFYFKPGYKATRENSYKGTKLRVNGSAAGRKFYYHCEPYLPSNVRKTKRNISATLLRKGKFTFRIDYNNLTDVELAVLLFSVYLSGANYSDKVSEKAYHKIGTGKALGLGTISIKINSLFHVNMKERYKNYDYKPEKFEGEKLMSFIEELIAKNNLNPKTNNAVNGLLKILEYDPKNLPEGGYPDKQWFDDNKDFRLEKI